MNNVHKRNSFLVLLIFSLTVLLSSCGTTQNVVYFSDLDSTKVKEVPIAEFKEPLIQTDDILSITIQTLDITATNTMNQTSAPGSGMGGSGKSTPSESAVVTGFLVDKAGNVEIPILGVMKLAGLTTTEAKELIRKRASEFYKDPTIQVRFANYKITVLGEVTRPSTYTLPNEKVTILDAISLAGDLTIYGKRENVLLMRDNGDKKEVVRLNLNSSQTITSPYYYLKQNDVIYVEPSKAKVAANNAPRIQLTTIFISIATLLVTIAAQL
jgi:polysaccharide export outer membrane protein